MPFLRVIRDKRGYETAYVMHWFRDGNRQYSRILYVSRSPSGVRVGRPALDPEVLRQLEDEYPGIDFDWKTVLDHRQVIEPPPEDRRPRRRRREEGEAGAPPVATPRAEGRARAAAAPAPAPAPAPAEARLVVPATVEGETPEERVAFLAHWHAVLTERIPRRTADPARCDALLALAARLNPADWTAPEDITAGLVQAADALDRLSHVFARRRRRTRKPAKPLEGVGPIAGASPEPGASVASADPADPADAAGPADAADPAEPADVADAGDAPAPEVTGEPSVPSAASTDDADGSG